MNTLAVFLIVAISWLDAGRPASPKPPRPKPIEPDVASNGPFKDPVAPIVAPEPKLPTWKADSNGFWWSRDSAGNLYYGPDPSTVRQHGQPVNG